MVWPWTHRHSNRLSKMSSKNSSPRKNCILRRWESRSRLIESSCRTLKNHLTFTLSTLSKRQWTLPVIVLDWTKAVCRDEMVTIHTKYEISADQYNNWCYSKFNNSNHPQTFTRTTAVKQQLWHGVDWNLHLLKMSS